MKTRFTIALLLAVVLLFTAACDPQTADAKLDAVEDAVEQRLDDLEDRIEGNVQITPAPVPKDASPVEPASVPTPADTPSAPAETTPAPVKEFSVPAANPPQRTEALTKEQAQTIALDHAGFTQADVERLHTEYDLDDGVPEYEVQFRVGRWEYEYEIHAETGAIRSYDKDD